MKTFRILSVIFGLLLLALVIVADLNLAPDLLSVIYVLPFGDKIGHFILMGVMSLLLNVWTQPSRVTPLRISRTSLFFFAIVAIEEASQIFFPTRTVSWIDLSADMAGIFLLGELGCQLGHTIVDKKSPGYSRQEKS